MLESDDVVMAHKIRKYKIDATPMLPRCYLDATSVLPWRYLGATLALP